MDKSSFNLKIILPDDILYEGAATMVVAPSEEGEIGLMYGHMPIISSLSKGHIKIYNQSNVIKKIDIDHGIIRTQNDCIEIILPYIVT
jgi:F-type H+-transporting ATPase subunit epsilon